MKIRQRKRKKWNEEINKKKKLLRFVYLMHEGASKRVS